MDSLDGPTRSRITTMAAALAAGSAVAEIGPHQRTKALFLLTIIAGIAMIAAGVLRLGSYTQFVSLSVMTGRRDRDRLPNVWNGRAPRPRGPANRGRRSDTR